MRRGGGKSDGEQITSAPIKVDSLLTDPFPPSLPPSPSFSPVERFRPAKSSGRTDPSLLLRPPKVVECVGAPLFSLVK